MNCLLLGNLKMRWHQLMQLTLEMKLRSFVAAVGQTEGDAGSALCEQYTT